MSARLEIIPLLPPLPPCREGYIWLDINTAQSVSPTMFKDAVYIAEYNTAAKSWNAPEPATVLDAHNMSSNTFTIRYTKRKKGLQNVELAWSAFQQGQMALAYTLPHPPKRRFSCFPCC